MKSFKKFKEEISEVLKISDTPGEWIKDFQKSDAPQFKGAGKAKRRQMAIAAYLQKQRETKESVGVTKEEVELDERNKENAMKRKNMDALRGARYKLNNPVPDSDHKTARDKNKAIGRALRNEGDAQTADKKPENYTDPREGKKKVRMVPVDKKIVDKDKVSEARIKQGQSAADRIADRFKKLSGGQSLEDRRKYYERMRDEAKKRMKETQKESVERVEEAVSKKLQQHLQQKHGSALKTMSPADFRAAKAEAEKELKATSAAKKAAPKPVIKTSKGKTHTGSADPADKNIIMQMRKAQDAHTASGQQHYDVRVSPTRTVKVHHSVAKKALTAHDNFNKPQQKREFRIKLIKALRKQK